MTTASAIIRDRLVGQSLIGFDTKSAPRAKVGNSSEIKTVSAPRAKVGVNSEIKTGA